MFAFMSDSMEDSMSESEKRLHRVCFTGHRPEKLHSPEAVVLNSLEAAIKDAIQQGYTTFITGMAKGVDIWAGEIVLREKQQHPGLHLICALPYPEFGARWSEDWHQRYQNILQHADLVRTVCPAYHRSCFQRRNEWMVDHSALVIAAYNGESGGTRNTIDYAQRMHIPIRQILE